MVGDNSIQMPFSPRLSFAGLLAGLDMKAEKMCHLQLNTRGGKQGFICMDANAPCAYRSPNDRTFCMLGSTMPETIRKQ